MGSEGRAAVLDYAPAHPSRRMRALRLFCCFCVFLICIGVSKWQYARIVENLDLFSRRVAWYQCKSYKASADSIAYESNPTLASSLEMKDAVYQSVGSGAMYVPTCWRRLRDPTAAGPLFLHGR